MDPDQSSEAAIWTPPSKKPPLWTRLGGGALAIAVFFHVILFIIGAIWIFQIIREPEKKVDFLPGDGERGGGERSAQHQIQQKKRAQITPTTNVKRVFAEGASSTFAIPEQGDDFGQMSALSSLAGGGSMGGGLGGSGGGKGFGVGSGSGLGTNGLSIKMFGLELQGTEKIAVVMDVSRSMTKYLPLVSKELGKLPSTAPLVLYFGCGLAEPPSRKKTDDRIRLTTGPQFERFWQVTQGAPLQTVFKSYDTLEYDPKGKMPLKAMYQEMVERPDTFFLDFNGIHFTQAALICNEVKDADTIYWFADFQDKVDESEMKDVLRKLKSRRQKLIMHAPIKGRNFDMLEKGLAKKSGGQAILKEIEK